MSAVFERAGVKVMESPAKKTRGEDGEDVEDDGASLDDGEGDLDDESQEEEAPSDEDSWALRDCSDHREVVGAETARGRTRTRTGSRRWGTPVGPEEHGEKQHDDPHHGGSDESPCRSSSAKRARHRPSSGSRGNASVHAHSPAFDSAKMGPTDYWIAKMGLDEIADGVTKWGSGAIPDQDSSAEAPLA